MGARPRRSGRLYSPRMMDSNSNGRDEPATDVVPGAAVSPERWLSGLLRADVLALTGVVAAAAALFGVPYLQLALSSVVYMDPENQHEGWLYGPPLVAAGIAMVAGLLALRQAAAQASRGWVRALAGAATLIGILVAIGTAVVWIFAPDPAEMFGRL